MFRRYMQSILLSFILTNFAVARYCGQQQQHSNLEKLAKPSNGGHTTIRPQQSVVDQNGGKINRCCPYDFDSRLCKIIDDRVLCGYDRNIGSPQSKNHKMELSQGCRLRGSRLECGYVHRPFTNPRRPPGNDPIEEYNNGDDNIINVEDSINGIDDSDNLALKGVETTTMKSNKQVTKCLEIRDRIVCRGLV